MIDIDKKREDEKVMIKKMIIYYCKKNRHDNYGLCDDCNEMLEYSLHRISKCPLMETKTFCSNCRIHCFKPEMRDKIKKVMIFSGQRMIFREPIAVIKHIYFSIKEKKALANNTKSC